MNLLRSRIGFAAVLTTGALLGSTAWGATQVLDRVVGVGAAATSQMSFEVPPAERNRPEFKPSIPYYTVPTSATKGFTACQASIKGGVVCIDEGAGDIREWTTPAKSQPSNFGVSLFSCADLGFTTKGGSSGCSGLALQPDAIWVAGRKSNNLYSLVKVVPAKGGSCDPGSSSVGGLVDGKYAYCKIDRDYATGRPLLQELNALDPELADLDPNDAYGRGVYGVELRSTILFYKDTDLTEEPVVIGSKKDLGVSGKEQVLSAALTRLASGTFVYLYVTDKGRVLAINRDKNVPVEVFNVATSRAGWAACASDGDFGLTVSKFGRIYLSDRGYCRVLALGVTSAGLDSSQSSNYGFRLEMVDALSTSPMAPESVSVAPGVVLNVADCAGSCTYVSGTDESGDPTAGAKMSNIQVQDNGKTYMTVYKVEGIPDCRFLSDERCAGKGSVIGTIDGWKQLDVKPLLPKEIQDLLPSSLQRMLISPQWHADPKKGYVFDALFGITEPGLEFKGVGAGEVFVKELTGNERGCVDPALGSTAVPLVTEGSQRGLVELDISTTVSENYVSITNGQSGNVDTIINSGCGSTRQVIVSWSLKPVDLVLNPVTVHRNIFNLSDDQTKYRTCEHPDGFGTCKPDDAIFAKLVDTLYGDLKKMLDEQACMAVDKDSAGNLIRQPPLAPSYCSSLASVWDNGRDKLNKCLSATTQPKQSAGDQNCSAFGSQLKNFITTAQSVPPAAPGGDPANRVGEVQGRAKVIEYLLNYRFLPSIPANGFCEDPTNSECGMTVVP